ncbi:retrovirus-related Pol polyprotein from transposon 17.6 [Trichonephila clavipes]|uniref:Retrovirus-related Pol polyprotein from transposon 17.6 n=1 Tax=Trichonephila clavipes TaxID=2585209 RepID=A0A8X7BDJ2_TRICX|nr:retrovirus-related Pol polyprotein from transposon 17.6 [Trichonephila clavipes]
MLICHFGNIRPHQDTQSAKPHPIRNRPRPVLWTQQHHSGISPRAIKRPQPYQPGLTHVLYHEIDTGNKEPVVSRSYRYDRVKQGIIDYHIEKMLQKVRIRPIQSPYASPVVLTRKNNGLPPDSPEAYRFAIDYRKLNAITKYPYIYYR